MRENTALGAHEFQASMLFPLAFLLWPLAWAENMALYLGLVSTEKNGLHGNAVLYF